MPEAKQLGTTRSSRSSAQTAAVSAATSRARESRSVHHRGRKSGREYVNPMMYVPDDADNDAIYVFATKAGAPSNPDWYYNSPPPARAPSNAAPRRTS